MNTYLVSPELETTQIHVPLDNIGNGEATLIIIVDEEGLKFMVLDGYDEVLYQASDDYENFCNFIEARDLYLDAAIERHPANKPVLQIIDGGGKEK